MSAALADWGVAERPCPGERVNGDAAFVAPYQGGLLAGVIDGLGHGQEAAVASRAAIAAIEPLAGRPLADIVGACHEELRRTRGAALSLATIESAAGALTWIGVGNVEAVLFRGAPGARRETLTPRAGVVGYQLPPLREQRQPIAPGDTLIMASDGVSSRFCERAPRLADAQGMAHQVLDAHRIGRDDALVLVIRYLGGAR
jgi:serine/threonine protein phosphatase PrpC